jgi:hypothetical protein
MTEHAADDHRDRDAGFTVTRRTVRRRLPVWLLLAVSIALVVGFIYLQRTSPPPVLSTESYERIELGMSESAVRGVVRATPGGYGPAMNPHYQRHEGTGQAAVRFEVWSSPDGYLRIGYDDQHRVCYKWAMLTNEGKTSQDDPWYFWKRQLKRQVPDSKPGWVFTIF